MAIGTLIKSLSKRIKNAQVANITKNGVNKAGLRLYMVEIPPTITRAEFSKLVVMNALPSQILSLFKRSVAIKSVQGATVSTILPNTKNIDKLADKGFNQIKGYKPQSKFSNSAKIENVERAINQSNDYSDVINIIYNGLEALKLGSIVVEFEISGDIKHRGIVGVKPSEGMERSILTITHKATQTSVVINALAYRGFRSNDPDQGIGIERIKSMALSQLKNVYNETITQTTKGV